MQLKRVPLASDATAVIFDLVWNSRMWSGDEHIKPTAVAAEAYLGDGGHSVGMARTLGGQGRYYSVHLRDGGPDGDDQRH